MILTDDIVEVVKDFLVALEAGDDIQSTSIYHKELKDMMLAYNWISKEELDRRIKEGKEERKN